MQGVTESMAGRAAVFQLLPFSTTESPKVSWFHGGFPEVIARPGLAETWFRSYVQTYLERDVRQVTAVHDLATFRRFLGLVATRCGQVVNRTDLAAPLGLTVPTITRWLSILEITGQILLVPPYFENFGKRLTKSPKLYFVDPGLACHLLGIETEGDLLRSPFAGSIFETFVASEIVKAQVHSGRTRALYFFRDAQGLEVDFVVPRGGGRLALIEAKASRTAMPSDAEPMMRLARAMPKRTVDAVVVHRRLARDPAPSLRPGVRAVSTAELLDVIA